MFNYYIERDNKILAFDTDRQALENAILAIPSFQGLEIKETTRPIVNYQFADTEEYKAEQAQKEREELDKLSLTRCEVFLALYKDKGITPEQLKAQITDPQALIEFEYANDYFRGNPLINQIGEKLGYTTEELDYLFQNGELPVKEEPEEPETDETENVGEPSDTSSNQPADEKEP